MKRSNYFLVALALCMPLICNAGEPSKGTVIMISGVSSWLVLSSGFILWKEIKRSKQNRDNK
jgi:hypothetical protein